MILVFNELQLVNIHVAVNEDAIHRNFHMGEINVDM